ncbi:MAG TPA: G-D-S-L family lipolytic protein, partial [Bacteroidales bacterium]|nr:G-D-S-L family lipolytic protein [Bacteroidales bacterium]
MAFVLPSPKRVIFFGDSITQMGAEPGGYIDLMRSMLKVKNADGRFELMGSGIGGNKVYDLYQRLEKDVLAKKPDIVVVLVGVNDVLNKTWGKDVDAGKFELFYQAMIRKIKASGAEVVLCTPAVIGEKTDFSNHFDEDLNKYATIVLSLAKEEKCTLVDLRSIFLKYNLNHNPR